MGKNAGTIDKGARLIIGIALILYGVTSGNLLIAGIAIVPIGTALLGWCPLYSIFGISTVCGKGSCETKH